jgi:hypothetical protein
MACSCMRVLHHHADTNGFFVALFEKVGGRGWLLAKGGPQWSYVARAHAYSVGCAGSCTGLSAMAGH